MNYKFYKLVEQLKEAGFPQIKRPLLNKAIYLVDGMTIPTLEELIDECGDGTTLLKWKEKDYRAGNPIKGVMDKIDGETPFEAVAKLYLKLNKK